MNEVTAKQEAKRIFDKMYSVIDPLGKYSMCHDTAKQCAMILVEDRIKQNGELYLNSFGSKIMIAYYTIRNSYLFELKQELEKL